MRLIIVESPTKSQTISKFLGPQYKVLSSFGHIRDLPKGELGVDVENNEEFDLMKHGIIDPTKVTRTALENAASIAGTLLTTEALVADLPEKNKEAMPAMPQGMPGMM